MKAKSKVKTTMIYDQEADLLIIDYIPPYVGQDADEIEDGVFVLSNPKTGNVEGVRILSFTKRFELTLPTVLKKRAGKITAVQCRQQDWRLTAPLDSGFRRQLWPCYFSRAKSI
jgi:hypothetical protein